MRLGGAVVIRVASSFSVVIAAGRSDGGRDVTRHVRESRCPISQKVFVFMRFRGPRMFVSSCACAQMVSKKSGRPCII